jgi:hypothetical protein
MTAFADMSDPLDIPWLRSLSKHWPWLSMLAVEMAVAEHEPCPE